MKNAERVDLPVELERRLKRGIDRLGEMREAMEELVRIADAIQPLLGVVAEQERAGAAAPARPVERAAPGRASAVRPGATPPPAAEPRSAQGASAASTEEEIPEWRKMFPGLSAQYPGRSK